jgi:homoserine dehydrogenase
VLPSRNDLGKAVDEIYRSVRRGEKVVAVVSAFGDTTDLLLEQARAFCAEPDMSGLASLVATGEATAASYLVLALDQAGIQAELFDASRAGLYTDGDALDATPIALDVQKFHDVFEESSVIVMPGFVGRSATGAQTLLGRGGSDLTALFVADQLEGQCVLFKDVDGYYDADPNQEGSRASRFESLSWDTALKIGGGVVQEKSIYFSRVRRLPFAVRSPGLSGQTSVGPFEDVLAREAIRCVKQRVVLLGCGTVGVGVLKRLQELPHRFEVVAIAVHDITKKRSKQVPTALLRDNPEEALAIPHDITIEVMGGLDLPLALIEKSIRAGRHVITANKEVIAQYGVRLEGLAKQEGKQLLYAASVGGAVPCIEAAIRLSESGPIEAAVGVLNGTTNFVLDEMAVGSSFEAAVHAAQKAGFAEADPTNDLNGADVARKLSILIRRGFGEYVASEDIRCEGIEEIGPKEVAKAKSRGEVIRLVAECRRSATGVDAWISPRYLPQSHPLARVRAERNAITFYRDGGPLETVNGKGAGRFPTAQAVIGDLWDLLFDLDAEGVANESDSRVHYLPRARSKPCAEAV